jgi:hypothetical protein
MNGFCLQLHKTVRRKKFTVSWADETIQYKKSTEQFLLLGQYGGAETRMPTLWP